MEDQDFACSTQASGIFATIAEGPPSPRRDFSAASWSDRRRVSRRPPSF